MISHRVATSFLVSSTYATGSSMAAEALALLSSFLWSADVNEAEVVFVVALASRSINSEGELPNDEPSLNTAGNAVLLREENVARKLLGLLSVSNEYVRKPVAAAYRFAVARHSERKRPDSNMP